MGFRLCILLLLVVVRGFALESESQNYFLRVTQNGGALTTVETNAVDALVVTLKASGAWTNIDDMGLLCISDADGSLVKLVYSASLTNLTKSGTPIFTEGLGYSGDGSSGYLQTGFAPADVEDFSAGVYLPGDGQHSGPMMGDSASSPVFYLDYRNTFPPYCISLLAGVYYLTNSVAYGHGGNLRALTTDGANVKTYANGSVVNTAAKGSAGSITSVNVLQSGGAYGVASDSVGVAAYWVGTSMSAAQIGSLHTGISNLLYATVREHFVTTTNTFIGDSITLGSGADATSNYVAIVTNYYGVQANNRAVGGSTLLNYDSSDAANGIDNFYKYAVAPRALEVYELYGLNDQRKTASTNFTAANFQTELGHVVNQLLSLGWNRTNIHLGSPSYVSSNSFNMYVAEGYGGNSFEKQQGFRAAVSNVAVLYGTYYADVFGAMTNSGDADDLVGVDLIHANNAGHAVIAAKFLANEFTGPQTNWYVDGSLTNSLNTGTSWNAAWTNLASIESQQITSSGAQAGHTIWVKAGTYTDSVSIGGGTRGNPITIKPYAGQVVFDGQDGSGTNALGLADGVVLDGVTNHGFYFKDWFDAGDYTGHTPVWGNLSWGGVRHCLFTNVGQAISFSPGVEITISDCEIRRARGNGAIYAATATGATNNTLQVLNCLIETVTATDYSGGGPDGIQAGDGLTVSNCVFWCIPVGGVIGSQHPDSIQTGGNNIRVLNNTFHNVVESCFSSDPPGPVIRDIVFANNVMVRDNTNYNGGAFASGYSQPITSISNVFWLNNTIVDFSTAKSIGYEWQKESQASHPTVTNFYFINNLIYRCGDAGGYWADFGSYSNTNFDGTEITLVKNLTYYDSEEGDYRLAHNITTPTYFWQQPPMTNQPTFTAYTFGSTNSNFRLSASDTAARGQGTNLTSMFSALNIPAIDKAGTARSAAGAWDIGAYEYVPPTATFGTVNVGTLIIGP